MWQPRQSRRRSLRTAPARATRATRPPRITARRGSGKRRLPEQPSRIRTRRAPPARRSNTRATRQRTVQERLGQPAGPLSFSRTPQADTLASLPVPIPPVFVLAALVILLGTQLAYVVAPRAPRCSGRPPGGRGASRPSNPCRRRLTPSRMRYNLGNIP